MNRLPVSLLATVLWLSVSSACVHAQKPVTPDDDSGRKPARSSLLDQLTGGSRDLSAPVELGDVNGDPSRQQVLMYYANETSADGAGADNVRTLTEWLRSSDNAEVRAMATSIESDADRFADVVERETSTIRAARAKLRPAQRPAVVLITNAMARAGHMQVAAAGKDFRRVPLQLPEFDDAILQAWPLASASSMSAVIDAVAELLPPTQHEYVLVTKSHGNRHFALTTRVALNTSVLERQRVLAKLEADADQQMDEFRHEGRLLTTEDGQPVKLKSGGAIYEKAGALRAAGRGLLRLKQTDDDLRLVDCTDVPVLTEDGHPIALNGSELIVTGTDKPLRVGDDIASIRFLVGPQRHPIPLADSNTVRGLFAESSQRPLIGKPQLLAAADPNSQSGTAHKSDTNRAEGLDPNSNTTLSKDGTLDPNSNNTLGVAGDIVLDPDGEFGVDKIGQPLVFYRGISKSQFVEILQDAGQRGLTFPLLFAESCKSRFGLDRLALLQADIDSVAWVWTSDVYGLTYDTLDYAPVFVGIADGQRLSQAMMQTLADTYREQRQERAASGTVADPDVKRTDDAE